MADPSEFSAVHATFVPKSNMVAVTTSTRIDFIDIKKKDIAFSYTRFKELARTCSFRPDGSLFVCADNSGLVQVINTVNRNPLRLLKGHMGPVHAAIFASSYVVSAGDDRVIKLWNLASERVEVELDGHTDSIRSMCRIESVGQNWIASGSYDGTVRVWDLDADCVRSPKVVGELVDADAGASIFCFNHGAHVEAIACVPGGSLLLSAGGNVVRLWDLSSGKLVEELAGHTKAITGVTISPDGAFMLSTSLDGTCKVHCLATLECCANIQLPSDGRFIEISPDGNTFAICTSKGVQLRRRRYADDADNSAEVGLAAQSTTIRVASIGGGSRVLTRKDLGLDENDDDLVIEGAVTLETRKRVKLSKVNVLIRQFRYQEAITEALASRDVVYICTVLDELARRGALEQALRGVSANPPVLVLALEIIGSQLGKNPSISGTLIDSLSILLNESNGIQTLLAGHSATGLKAAGGPDFIKAISNVRGRILMEMEALHTVSESCGALDLILTQQRIKKSANAAANSVSQ